MSRFNDIAQIYDYKLSQLRDPQVWQNTLKLTSNFWRLNFCAAMLLTEQNPKAVMCGTLTQWNNVGRYVRHGERSTAIFMDRNNTELMYLFDVSQTYGKTYNAKWKLSERMADGIVGKYNTENAENAISFEDFLQKSLDKNIDTVYNYDSKLISAMANDPRITHFIRQSAECICMTRCGLEAEYDFSAAAKLDSDLSIVEIGNAATALAQEVLRDVDRTVRRKEYERYEAGVCGRHLRYPLRGRQERTAEPEIPELRKEGHDAAGAQGGRYDERNGSDSARPGEHEWAVSENLEGDRTESRERQESHDTYSDEEGAAQPDLYGERTAEDGNRYSGSGSSVGFDPDERDMAGGGSPEPWAADEDQGYSAEYDDEELNEDNEMVSDETDAISVFSDRPEEIDSKSEYAQKLLEDEILHGNHSAGGKFRITEYISDNSPTNDELAKFLKNEYGIGGSSRSGIVKFSNHDGKGLALILGNNGNEQTVRFGWKVVAKAIRKAVDEGRYITEKDIESARRYTQFDAEHFAIHYEYPHCFENSRLQSIRKDIKRTGLDIQIRLTPELFATYAEEYIRAQPHVKEEYQKIERSSVNAPYCFNDWSTAAEAARTLTAESGYPKFRSLCRDSASELVTQLTNHTGHNPGLGFPEEEITEFLNSGEISEDKWTDEITAQVFGYLFNIEQRDHLYDNNVAAFSEETSAQLTFDNFEEEKSDMSIGIVEPTEKDISEKQPTITCEWSESPAFEEGKTYSVLEFDTIMKREDTDWVSKRQQELEAYGGNSDKLYAAIDSGELKDDHQGYAKTKFTINMPDGTTYSERQDIGDGYGGVVDYLSSFKAYHSVAEKLKKAISDELEQHTDELPHDEAASSGALEAAIEYINDFCETEYGSTADFDDLTHVDLAYTTDEDTDTIIGVYADLVNYRIITEYGNANAREEQYDSLDEMNEVALKNLAFDDLVYLSEEEKALPHDEAADFSVNDNSDIPDFFIRDIEEHKEIRISEKEKTALLYPVDNASDLKLGNYRLSYIGDESAYALIADSEKAGADIFVHQFSHNDGASEIYSYLREKDMQPYHDDTEVPHRDAPVPQENIERSTVVQTVPPVGNYRFPENFAYPTGPKAKYTANVTAIKTLKQIESEHRHATAEEQDILAHYSGWGGIADAFDSTKENWSREYAELKDLLTDKEYSAARESTLTAFYTEPYIIKNIYTALENMGFTGGEILDPAMGTGNFFGNLPAEMAKNSRLYGVELDSLTARIAKELYPEAKIQNRGFERTKFVNGTFDVIVGNVPFGDFKPYDPEYDEYLIHDYFFAKSIDKLKPGGIMALITSAGTMDKYDDSFRRELSGKADFLGGVRLPEDAFRTAGTQTVTDILFFQKLGFEHENDRNLDWVRSERVYGEASVFQENRYFRQNPEMVLGTPGIVSGRFGNTRTIKSDGNTAERLSEAIGRLDGNFSAEPTIDDELPKEEYGDIPDGVTPYTYYVSGGSLYYAENRSAVPFTGSSEPRIKAMCGILDRLNEVTAAQKKGCSDDELKALQSRLNNAYDGFVKKYGHLNSRTNISAFADDIRAPRLTSIENVEELPDGKQRFTKADIFTERTINVDRVPAHVDTALEALHLSINLKQTVDLEYISQLCGKDKDAVISELGEHIYCNPAKNTGGRYSGWETAEEYLSGHVRTKLALAQEAAKTDPDYERNAAALLDNQPPRIGIEDIGFRIGTIYIEPEMFQDFVYETFQTPEWQRHRPNMHGYSKEITVNYSPEMNQWKVTNSSGMSDVLSTETYGTKRLNAYELTELLLNQKRAVVNDYRELPDGRKEKVFNAKETILARECQDKIEQAFHDWVMADKDRIQIIEDRFNALFNNIKPRTYNGDYITIPGMNPNLTLRPHQKNVIARIAATGTCMMAHEVGAGKTAAMGAAGMYLKSIGACTKPMYVVPNAVVAQFGEELQRFFPEAKILVATSKDMEKSQRRRFLSKISVGNFDAIVIPQSQFEKMPLSLERQEAMYDEKLTEISSAIQAAKADKGERFTVKALERQRKQIEKKIEKMRAAFKKDDFITFEELGCDFLFVDEAHNYKNLAVFSKMNNVAGVNANANSQKAFDMEMKCRYLQELHNGGGVVFATGTPISNSITELFVWQYLLQKQTLDDMNIGYFDNWASVFGVITQSIEVKPSGDGFRPRTRFSNFVNLNELCNLFGEVFDIAKTADMNLKLPAIQNGKPEMIICEKSPEQELQTDEGIERARKIEAKMVQPDEDNMLAVCTYMTKVALDARIIDPEANEYDGGKVALCAEKIIEINRANPGTAQAVFCDTNTPKKDAFSVYQALRDRLVRSGEFAENEIAFVHDAANDKQRLAMFERVNNAEIKIIIGSTGKLGTGVNIQRKLSALHHLDAPYRPSDIEQRNGRGIRQGNENSEVYIGYYSTKGTFDNYRWQILEKKQQIISQIMSGKPAARTCEDIDDTALTFAEMKAATTGNPLIAEKMTVDNEVNRLKLLQANYYQQQRSFEYDISRRYPDLISRKEKMIEWTKKDIELISAAPPITEDNFRMTLDGRTYVERTKAGDELSALVTKYMMSDDYQEYKPREIGKLNDFKIMLLHKGALVSLSLKANGHYTCDYSMSGLGGVTRLCNLYERIPEQIHGLTAELEQAKKQLANAKEQYGKPFQYEEQLRAGLERQAEINAELEVADKPHDEAVMGDCSDDEGEEMEM